MTEMVETEYDWKKEILVYKGHLFPDEPSKTRVITSIRYLFKKFPYKIQIEYEAIAQA